MIDINTKFSLTKDQQRKNAPIGLSDVPVIAVTGKLEKLFSNTRMKTLQTRRTIGTLGGGGGAGLVESTLTHPCNDHETAQPDTWQNTGSNGGDCGADDDVGDGVCVLAVQFVENYNS